MVDASMVYTCEEHALIDYAWQYEIGYFIEQVGLSAKSFGVAVDLCPTPSGLLTSTDCHRIGRGR